MNALKRIKTVTAVLAVLAFLAGGALLAAWQFSTRKPGKLSWDPLVTRKGIMSVGYKVYENPDVDNGRFFLTKLVLRNEGQRSVRDLEISYQVPDFISWTTPERVPEITAGSSYVAVYYPHFPEKISRLFNQTKANVEIKLHWREDGDATREEVLRDDFTIYGVNEIQYSDVASDEMLTWYDNWTQAQFLICMVTPNDPVVKEYAAAITNRIGGTLAGVSDDPKHVIELMKATFDYMRATGMRYAGAKGVPESLGDVNTLVQTIRLPRDVITTNNGLCVELALLWASIMDHLGCTSYVVLRPGHAFTLVEAGQQIIPIECTAITPKAVGEQGPVSFEQAVNMANEDFQKQQTKIVFSVRQYQSQGYVCPELPDMDSDKIRTMLAAREQISNAPQGQFAANRQQTAATGPDQQAQPEEQQQAPAPAGGMAQYEHREGLFSFRYPSSWQVQTPAKGLGVTFSAADPQTLVGTDVVEVTNAPNWNIAFRALARAFARNGLRLEIINSKQQGDLTVVYGRTSGGQANYDWLGVFRPTRGEVAGVTVGGPTNVFRANQNLVLKIIDTIHFQ